ncbi:MAG: hypothetical protein H0V07_06430 [Propionibacteriales bacterium]|nr:hypothetical protein [Propionibacteriales bacterium]
MAIATELVELLWPGATLVRARSVESPTSSMLCLPSTTKVRSLVPVQPPAVPAGVIARRLSGRGLRVNTQRVALVGLLRTGLMTRGSTRVAHLEPSAAGTGLTELLSDLLRHEVFMAIHLGAPRANRKPVLELLDRAGRAVAFGKLGINPLTDRLVDAEATALTTLATRELTHVLHPAVIARTSWQGHPLLLQTPLPVEHARQAPTSLVATAAREVSGVADGAPTKLPDTPYFKALTQRVSLLPHGEAAELLGQALVRLAAGDAQLSCGAWHGDWTSWNMATVSGRLMVWDWERYESDVPDGFDLLHHAFQSAVQRNPLGAPAHARTLLARAPQILHWMDAATAKDTARLYVIEIASRYVGDGQAEAGGRLGHVIPWAAPVLESNEAEPMTGATG